MGPTPTPIPADVVDRFRPVEPSTIGHQLDAGFAHGLRQIVPGGVIVGTALTVRLADMDATAIHCAVDEIEPGHVLVVDMGGDRDRASLGSLLTFAAKARGVAGIVVDGMVTDYTDLIDYQVPVFARGLSAMTTRVLGVEGDINVPVSIGGAVVMPGQLVLADADGVLFIDLADAEAVLDAVLASQQWEGEFKPQILAGARISDVSGAAARLAANRVDVVTTSLHASPASPTTPRK